MSEKTLFLAWQDKARTRQWFPVGRLDADVDRPDYRFRYTCGAERAQQEAGFPLLMDFPDPKKEYHASELFPLFKNRVITSSRQDFADYVGSLGLSEGANPIEILTVNGGYRTTDSFEVFPKLVKSDDGGFACRFFLRGTRYLSEAAQQRCNALVPGDELNTALELTNPMTSLAVQIQTHDHHLIGWAPDYLARDLAATEGTAPEGWAARVVRVNPAPAPSRHRLLIEMRGHWTDEREPMSSKDFVPLVK